MYYKVIDAQKFWKGDRDLSMGCEAQHNDECIECDKKDQSRKGYKSFAQLTPEEMKDMNKYLSEFFGERKTFEKKNDNIMGQLIAMGEQQNPEHTKEHHHSNEEIISSASKEPYRASSELDEYPLETAEVERNRAKAWMDTAAWVLRNEEYWRDRAQTAEDKLSKKNQPSCEKNCQHIDAQTGMFEHYIELFNARMKNTKSSEKFSTSEIKNYFNLSLDKLNVLLEKELSFEYDYQEIAKLADLLVQGAVITALSAQMLLEKGREFAVKDYNVDAVPPDLSELMYRQWTQEMEDYKWKINLLVARK